MPWTSTQALETLTGELSRRGYDAKLIAPQGLEPRLAVRNPGLPMQAETVLAQAEWFWWPWADRIGPAGDVAVTGDPIVRVLASAPGGGE